MHNPPNMQAITDKMLFNFPDFMASPNVKKTDPRSRPLHSSRSFSKLESPPPERLNRSQRASTIPNGMISETGDSEIPKRRNRMSGSPPDSFDKMPEEDEGQGSPPHSEKLPADFDELPIELVSLTDRCVLSCTRGFVVLTFMQLYRFSFGQSPPDPSDRRQALKPLPRFLRSCCEPY